MLEQVMRLFFAQVHDGAARVGNLVDAHGDPVEGLLEALDRIQIAFGDDGWPPVQMIVNPADAERIRQALDAATSDQIRRPQEIINRKRRSLLLRDVVAAFLDEVTEREIDAPPLALLGFYDVHFLHGGFEFGQDFIAKGMKPPDSDVGSGDPASWELHQFYARSATASISTS